MKILGAEKGSMKFILPVFFALGSLNILFLQSKQLFQIVAFPGVIVGNIFGITDVMPFYQEAAFDFAVSIVFYFILGILIDLIWGIFDKSKPEQA